MKLAQILSEQLGNTTVNGVLTMIAGITNGTQQLSKNRRYCHRMVGEAIQSNQVSDQDYIVLVGVNQMVSHSLIVSPAGKPIVDSYVNGFKGFSGSTVTYEINGNPQVHDVITAITVGEFKREYL